MRRGKNIFKLACVHLIFFTDFTFRIHRIVWNVNIISESLKRGTVPKLNIYLVRLWINVVTHPVIISPIFCSCSCNFIILCINGNDISVRIIQNKSKLLRIAKRPYKSIIIKLFVWKHIFINRFWAVTVTAPVKCGKQNYLWVCFNSVFYFIVWFFSAFKEDFTRLFTKTGTLFGNIYCTFFYSFKKLFFIISLFRCINCFNIIFIKPHIRPSF